MLGYVYSEPSDAEDILLVSMDKDKDRSAVHKRRVTVSAIDAAPTQVGPAGMAVSAGLEGAGGGSRIVKRRIRRQASDIWSPEVHLMNFVTSYYAC